MTTASQAARWLALGMTVLLLVGPLHATAQTPVTDDSSPSGRVVKFPLTKFDDTLFVGVDASYRSAFDDTGDVWYTSEGGLVHVDLDTGTRQLYTKREGLPSSYSMGLAVSGDRVFVATDLGLGIVERATGEVVGVTPSNSPLTDSIVYEVALDGDDLWIGTRFHGVAIWDTTKPFDDQGAWTFKNTSSTPDYAKGVRRILPAQDHVWIATEGDGLWRYDRATGEYEAFLKVDGLLSSTILGVATRGSEIWIGTERGLQRWTPGAGGDEFRTWNASHGLPHRRVMDVEIIPTTEGTTDVFAATLEGLWQFNPETGNNVTRAQTFGILGDSVFDTEFDERRGWLFSTNRGVSLLRGANWTYFATGPSTGASNGPASFMFTSASVGDSGDYLWFGTRSGISAYHVPVGDQRGWWQNFGEWQNYPGSVVNWIDTEGNVTWVGTNQGTYGFEHDTGRWVPKLATNSRNLVYGLEAHGDELWVALFGDGLIMENLQTGAVRTWTYKSTQPLPDQHLTDVRVEGNSVWVGASVGLIKIDRVSGSILGTYTRSDGVPGDGVIFRTLPDGPNVWLGTKTGGVAQFDVGKGKVTRVWNETETPGFPEGEVRSLHREGGRLWVGTTGGLAQIDITTGATRTWTQHDSMLVQNYINGITSANGLIYLATLSGVQRMDPATGEFLPLRDGPGIVHGAREDDGDATASTPGAISVRIDSPRDGGAATGVTEIRGTAVRFGGSIDRVEVRIGQGDWQIAQGTGTWSLAWDTTQNAPDQPVSIKARAWSGENSSREAEILVTPVALPTIPLSIKGLEPAAPIAGRPLEIAAQMQGDEPLSGSLYYRPLGEGHFLKLPLTKQGALYKATIPPKDVREGELEYYLEARSGLVAETDPTDARAPHRLDVQPAPRLGVRVTGPDLVEASAGEATAFELTLTNVGTQPARFVLTASGLRSAWVQLPGEAIALEAGESRVVEAKLQTPARAFADNTTLTFEARDAQGEAEPAKASLPVRILASPQAVATSNEGEQPARTPVPAALMLLAGAGAALALRRRTE